MPQKYAKTAMETTFPLNSTTTMHRQEFLQLVGTGIGAILLTRCVAGCAGQAEKDPTPNPSQKVDFTLRLADKVHENLLVKGGYVIVNKVIIAQTKDGEFVAVSANCTHQGTILTYKSTENQFYCPLHLSRFDTLGKAIVGPATLPLTRFAVETNRTTGTIRVRSV